jgi:hypothetical protein
MSVRLFPLDVKKEAAQTMKRYGMRGLARTWSRALGMYITQPEVREIMKQGTTEVPQGLMDYFGYGLYTALKPD